MTSRVLISKAQEELSQILSVSVQLTTLVGESLQDASTLLQAAREAEVNGVYLGIDELTELIEGTTKLPQTESLHERQNSAYTTKEQVSGALIWLIDDEAPVRMTVRRWLTRLGYRIELFEQGQVLLKSLAECMKNGAELPSLLICDADMPEMSGIALLTRLRVEAPSIKRLLYTAREPSKWVIEAFNQGVLHRFVNKQDGPQALKTCLDDILKEERAVKEQLSALDELLQQELIELYIQPIFNAQTRVLEACEALMRSKHPAFKGPLDILDATTRAGRELDLQRLLTRLSVKLRKEIPSEIILFMNIDPVVFSQPQALDDVFAEIYPFADQIVLELTERGQLCGEVWVESVHTLRERGFKIALDDLGAGYNSLGAVAAVSPEIIKLDISLISEIHLTPPKREMVKLLSEYAQKYGIKTVGEGIELLEEADVCTSLDLTWLQGYFLSRPMPFESFKSTYLL